VDENGASLIGLACNSDLTSSDLSKFQVVQCKQNVNVDAQKKVKTLTYSPSGHSKVSSTPAIYSRRNSKTATICHRERRPVWTRFQVWLVHAHWRTGNGDKLSLFSVTICLRFIINFVHRRIW